jgi:hypothetical protein
MLVGKVEQKFAMSMFLAARPLLKPGLMGVPFRKTLGLIGHTRQKPTVKNPVVTRRPKAATFAMPLPKKDVPTR